MKYSSWFVYQLPSGNWRGALSYKDDGKWKKVYRTFPEAHNKTEAKRLTEAWRNEMESEATIEHPDKDVISYALNYVDYKLALQSIQPRTADDYRKSIRGWSPYLQGILLPDLTRQTIEESLIDMLQTISSQTALKRYVILKSVLDYAVSRHELINNPIDGIPRPKPAKSVPNSIVGDTLQSVTQTIANVELCDWKVGVCLCLYAGLRAEEACGLMFRDIDLENDVGWVRQVVAYGNGETCVAPPKNKQPRDFPICSTLKEILSKWIDHQKNNYANAGIELKETSWLLADPKVEIINTSRIGKKWSMLCDVMGWKGQAGRKPTLHDLRHTFATQCVKQGMDVKTLQSILGHSSAAMTLDIYASSDPAAKNGAKAIIDAAI